ncbi:MAG: radical SAM protein [Turicibacter sp.]|nr:radical SAM protein [Turicibacter sp.]
MRPLIIYGAGLNLDSAVEDFLEQGRTPVCIVDGDAKKHGNVKIYRGGVSLEIMSLEIAVERFPQSEFYVTPRAPAKFEIMNDLQKFGIKAEQIINFEPYEKKRGCRFLESMLHFEQQDIRFCCTTYETNPPKISLSDKSNEDLWKECLAVREKVAHNLKISAQEGFCQNCPYIEEIYASTTYGVGVVGFGTGFVCQYNCCYCTHPIQTKEQRMHYTEKALNFAKHLYKKEIINENTLVGLGNGEISINPMLGEIISTFKRSRIRFVSNGQFYSTDIENALKQGRCRMNFSLDAGTAETFKSIKTPKSGTADFDTVCQNIRRYAQYAPIELKYIIMPGTNDNKLDIDNFLDFAQEINATVYVSRDAFKPIDNMLSEKLLQTYTYFDVEMQKRNLVLYAVDFLKNIWK